MSNAKGRDEECKAEIRKQKTRFVANGLRSYGRE